MVLTILSRPPKKIFGITPPLKVDQWPYMDRGEWTKWKGKKFLISLVPFK
jgi:hypothetical protein